VSRDQCQAICHCFEATAAFAVIAATPAIFARFSARVFDRGIRMHPAALSLLLRRSMRLAHLSHVNQ
jgi:hypothetical protein